LKIILTLGVAVAALAITVGSASGLPGRNSGPIESVLCEPDEADGYASIYQQGFFGIHQLTVTNPCNSWMEFYFGVQDPANPDEEFFVPPYSSTVTVNHDELNKFGLDIKYNFWGGGPLDNGLGPCPPLTPSKAGYLIEPDGTLQPFSCP
jgi:hypothetical protein